MPRARGTLPLSCKDCISKIFALSGGANVVVFLLSFSRLHVTIPGMSNTCGHCWDYGDQKKGAHHGIYSLGFASQSVVPEHLYRGQSLFKERMGTCSADLMTQKLDR